MKKLIIILLFLPIISFGQEVMLFKKSDIIINQILENTFSFINKKNKKKILFKFELINKESLINWNNYRFSKWKINYRESIKK
jgi:hypothetical protein